MTTRRHVLAVGAALGLGGAVARHTSARANGRPPFATREYYDQVEAEFFLNGSAKPTSLNEDGGKLAWGQSHVLNSYLTMYHQFEDPSYLRLLVRNAEPIFASRDSERGVTDHRGDSLPAWRSKDPYTISSAIFLNEDQQRCVQVRAAWGDSIDVRITIGHDDAEHFFIVVDHPRHPDERFGGLSMDPQSPDYFVQRLLEAAPTLAGVTLVDVRTDTSDLTLPRTGNWGLKATHYVMAVNTAMITMGIADFCETVITTPGLQAEFGARAAEFLPLVQEAVHVHDDDWREDEETGFGWYAAARGAPVVFDGSDLPHNQYLALATVQARLYGATGDPLYRERVIKMLGNFRSDLHDNGTGGLWWPYWWLEGNFGKGYDLSDDISDHTPVIGPTLRVEDTSHAVIELWAVLEGYRRGWMFTDADLTRMARTFTDKVAISASASPDGMATTAQRIDGTGTVGTFDRPAGMWDVLAPWDWRIHRHLSTLYTQRAMPVDHGYTLSAVAQITCAEQQRP